MSRDQKILVVLLALASLGTTALVAMTVGFGRPARPEAQTLQVTPVEGGVFEQPIALPDFRFTERSGAAVGLSELRGRVWIADFVFTRCGGPCPMMSAQMAGLQKTLIEQGRLGEKGVQLVSFTVDPDFDTPAVLVDYARRYDASDSGWWFLTGPRPAMWQTVTEGFKLPVAENARDSVMPIMHSEKFVLIDRRGRVRGYYDGLREEGRVDLLRDVDRLLHE